MFSLNEIKAIAQVLDAGIRASGLQIFQSESGAHFQSAFDKLQKMAQESENSEKKNKNLETE